jgi:hypothetical protein
VEVSAIIGERRPQRPHVRRSGVRAFRVDIPNA